MQRPLDDLETQLGVRFADRSLLVRALTHGSFVNEPGAEGQGDNERLEFLGDAFLTYVAADYLYRAFPELDEGRLSALRAAIVNSSPLARFAAELGLGEHMLLGRGERQAGGWRRPRNLARAFEAVIGAVLLDRGPDAARELALRFLAPEVGRVLAEGSVVDAKSRLQAQAQGRLGVTPRYRLRRAFGSSGSPQFEVEVLLGEEPRGRGTGPSKQAAEQAAARQALERLGW